MQPHPLNRFAKVNITAEEICVWRRIGRRKMTKADRSGDDLRTEGVPHQRQDAAHIPFNEERATVAVGLA